MRRLGWIMATVVGLAMIGGVAPVFAGDAAVGAAPATTNVVKQQTICPVMGNEVNKKLFVDYQGKRVYVCCRGCLGDVKKDPAKYVKQLEAEGITLDKAEPAKAGNAVAPKGEDGHAGHHH